MELSRPRWFGLFVMAIGVALFYLLKHQRLYPRAPDLWFPVALSLLAASLLDAGVGILASWRTSSVPPVGVFAAAMLNIAVRRG